MSASSSLTDLLHELGHMPLMFPELCLWKMRGEEAQFASL